MESSKLWTTAMACAVLVSCIQGAEMDFDNESALETRALREFYPKDPNLTNEKQLLGALHDVLEKLQRKRISLWEKKFGRVPTCDVGEQCAIRKGSRIGKMCDCPRGAFCNYFLLKCL
ncbi:cocaine- and amphetamine-regulated transcript protein-like [Sinocyclocheilus anshuiensis]|uniref:Cocaine- and amphetamine-regulated transcript protein-like n=1 Tax=Sinocyclocheilus anshuiensis TaxID=1608454 RepID=A0A671KT61_9TELE|nr:PREDICTED: cocaine- and amphetamine-regulated transcript protein-like [Sinocyclocheilus anshuiensis]